MTTAWAGHWGSLGRPSSWSNDRPPVAHTGEPVVPRGHSGSLVSYGRLGSDTATSHGTTNTTALCTGGGSAIHCMLAVGDLAWHLGGCMHDRLGSPWLSPPLTPSIPHLGMRVMGICVGDHTNIRSFGRLMVIWPLTLHTLRPVDRSNLDLILDRSNLDLILRTTMYVRFVIVPQ